MQSSKSEQPEKPVSSATNKLAESTTPQHSPSPSPLPTQQNLYIDASQTLVRVREESQSWLSRWGGFDYWVTSLEASYQKALGGDYVDRWKEHISDHARKGQFLLSELRNMANQDLPQEVYQLRELWKEQLRLVEALTAGITLINLELNRSDDDAYASSIEL